MTFRLAFSVVSMAALFAMSGCQKKPEPVAKNNEKVTLMLASDDGDLSRVQKLLREGADVNERASNRKNGSALCGSI
jgi:hypothetical protein